MQEPQQLLRLSWYPSRVERWILLLLLLLLPLLLLLAEAVGP